MKKIFISYGHDNYVALADKLFDCLSNVQDAEGKPCYQVFKDDKGAIKTAHKYDIALQEAIKNSDFILFLMSEYSTRKDSVCLDEIAFARSTGGIQIIPLRIDNVSAPFLICRLQWIDWLDKPENFEMIFDQIQEALQNYDSIIQNNGQGIVFNRLFKADYYCEIENVIGREDVLEECINFIERDNMIGPLVLKGVAGSGKSAVMTALAKEKNVLSVHRCRFDDVNTRSVHNVLCNLAYFLSCNHQDYFSAITQEDLDKVNEWSDRVLFEKLFVKPLQSREGKSAVLIDGVDEMEDNEAQDLIAIIREGAKKLHDVKFIFSVRSEERFESPCKGLPVVELTDEKNKKAIRKMLEVKLQEKGVYSEELAKKILTASDGNFLYVSKLLEDYDLNCVDLQENVGFPQGLKAYYAQSIRRHFPDEGIYEKEYLPILSVLCAVKRPVTKEELSILTGQSIRETQKRLLDLTYLVKAEEGNVSLYHKSIIDFFLSEESGYYWIDVNDADKLVLSSAKNMDREEMLQNEYLKKYLFCHIFRQKDAAFADELCLDHWGWSVWCSVCSVCALQKTEYESFRTTVQKMKAGVELANRTIQQIIQLRYLDVAEAVNQSLYELFETNEYIGFYYGNKGTIDELSDKYKEAIKSLEKAVTWRLEQFDENLKKDLVGDFDYSRIPGYIKFSLIKLYKRQGKEREPEVFRQKYEKLVKNFFYKEKKEEETSFDSQKHQNNDNDNVSIPTWQETIEFAKKHLLYYSDICVGIMWILGFIDGEIMQEQYEEAESHLLEAEEVFEKKVFEYPLDDNIDAFSSLLRELGNLQEKNGRIQEAIYHYRKDYDLCKQAYTRFSSYDSRYRLIISCENLADIYMLKMKKERTDNEQELREEIQEILLKAESLAKENAVIRHYTDSQEILERIQQKISQLLQN